MKKLLITSTDLMMIQFLVPHVEYLSEHGFHVEIACSVVGDRIDDVRAALDGVVKAIHTVRLERSPVSPNNLRGYGDMKRLLEENKYDIIWTNEPVMGVVTRLAARKLRKQGTKVIYMCHGFHFYNGASLPSWLLYYPVERFMSRFCDMIVTINHEDEARAKTFHCPRVGYIHGIGVNTERLSKRDERSDIRSELGLTEKDFVVLSVGELNTNKNHQVIIRAIARLADPDIHYVLCGKGDQLENLKNLAKECGIADRVHFLGYRRDVVDICTQADVFAHPSKREGLSVASLEAMYCGLPVIMSTVRGATDYLEDGKSGFLCHFDDIDGFADGLRKLHSKSLCQRCGKRNAQIVQHYTLNHVQREILNLLETL